MNTTEICSKKSDNFEKERKLALLLLKYIEKNFQKKQTPLHLAASAGQESVCTLLIDLGASLDATDDYGQKPIHLAAQSNKATVVKTLLKQRPNLVRTTYLFNLKMI